MKMKSLSHRASDHKSISIILENLGTLYIHNVNTLCVFYRYYIDTKCRNTKSCRKMLLYLNVMGSPPLFTYKVQHVLSNCCHHHNVCHWLVTSVYSCIPCSCFYEKVRHSQLFNLEVSLSLAPSKINTYDKPSTVV